MVRSVPFYANTPDNTHCYQACIKMILTYFEPGQDFSWAELESATAKVEGLWTWPTAGMIWLQARGYDLRYAEDFDHRQFIEAGPRYLIERFGEAVAQEQITHSDIAQEYTYARELLQKIDPEVRVPTAEDVLERLDEGRLVVCNVNSRVLNKKSGYVGHFILVIGYTDEGLIVHDPGLPGVKNRPVTFAVFEKAWAYPNEHARNYIAVKRG